MMRTFRRRGFLQFAGLAGAATLCRALAGDGSLGGGAAQAASTGQAGVGGSLRKPNFLIVVADDMG